MDQLGRQNYTTDPQGWKEGSGKGFEVDDPIFRVQVMKGDSPAAIKINQIVILNNIDLIGLSQADNLLFFLQSIGSPQGIVEAGNSIEEGNLAGLENPLQLGQIKASKGPLNADKGQILLFHQGLHAVIGRTFQQNLFPLAAKIHLREDIEGLLGPCCDDQLVLFTVDIIIHEQLMAGGNQVLQAFLLVVVVEEVIFTAN